MLGNWATGRLKMVNEPTSTRTIDMTIATIGRLMKNFDMTLPACSSHEWLGIHLCPGPDLLNSFSHYAFAQLQPFRDDPLTADVIGHLDGSNADLVVGAYNGDLVRALQFRNCALRNKQSAILHSDDGANSAVSAWSQNVFRIRK